MEKSRLKYPSTSKSSSYSYKHTIAQATILDSDLENIARFANLCNYSLGDIYRHYLGHEYIPRYGGDHRDCAQACTEVLKVVLQHCVPSLNYMVEKATPRLHLLQPLLATLTQIPDVSLSYGDEVTSVSLIEIHSSPYDDTIRKALITGLDLLRLRRTYCDVNKVTTFAFPKLVNPQCVVIIEISFETYTFMCYVKALESVEDIGVHLPHIFKSFNQLHNQALCDDNFVIRLTKAELGCFPGAGTNEQLPARESIIIRNKDWVYKRNVWRSNQDSLEIASAAVKAVLRGGGTLHCAINLHKVIIGASAEFFRYPHVRHDPLTHTEAKRCLMVLYRGIHNALKKVHSELELGHMDVRLNNVCFNEQYEPVLIDFDRSLPSTRSSIPEEFGLSCMYPRRDNIIKLPEQIDWVQLGWVIAWVICDGQYDYHSMTYDRLPEDLQRSEALKSLIQKGDPVDPDTFERESFNGNETIESVISSRVCL